MPRSYETMKHRDAIEFHQALASEWEHKYRKASFQSRDGVVLDLLPRGALTGQHWLDAGCGSGRFTRVLAQRGATVLGVDAAAGMVEAAQTLSSAAVPLATLQFMQVQTISKLDMPSASLDGVLCNSVLEYLPDPALALAEMVRVLKPGGILLISVPNRRSLFRQGLFVLLGITRRLGSPRPSWLVHSVNEYREEDFMQQVRLLGLDVQAAVYFGGAMPELLRHARRGGSLMFFRCLKKS